MGWAAARLWTFLFSFKLENMGEFQSFLKFTFKWVAIVAVIALVLFAIFDPLGFSWGLFGLFK